MTEADNPKPYPRITGNECKACGRCVNACPREVLSLSPDLNDRGYHYAVYAGDGCTGCANCFYVCPEPHAVEVHIPDRT